MIERVLAPVSDEDIFEAVVIIVAYRNGTSPPGPFKTGFDGDIGESSIAIVLIQPIGCARRCAIQASAAKDKNVEPAVVVEIEKAIPRKLPR
jgi:hypothetical protein